MIHKTIITNNRKVNLSFTVPENFLGKELEFIVFSKTDELVKNILMPTQKGNALSIDEFKKWIELAEQEPTISLAKKKQEWSKTQKKLLKIIK
jgi:hypothetical protein